MTSVACLKILCMMLTAIILFGGSLQKSVAIIFSEAHSQAVSTTHPNTAENNVSNRNGAENNSQVFSTTILDTTGEYTTSIADGNSGRDAIAQRRANNVWYGVTGFFPFVGVREQGYSVGESESSKAWHLASKYYSLGLYCDAPDGTQYDLYESNYRQFNSSELGYYRRARWEDCAIEPKQPTAYHEKIIIDVAELNYIFSDGLCSAAGADKAVHSLNEMTALQNQWINDIQTDAQLRKDWYYAVSGLCVLNGDSRTKDTYYTGSRAKNIRITINGMYARQVLLKDTPSPQLIDLDYTQSGVDKPVHIEIEVIDSYDGNNGYIYITEIGIGLDSNIPQGR